VRSRIEDQLDHWLETRGRPWLTRTLTGDPSMPSWLATSIRSTIDALWPDIKLELWAIYENRTITYEEDDDEQYKQQPQSCYDGHTTPTRLAKIKERLEPWRSWGLYTLYPYNKSLWGKISNGMCASEVLC
jgi:hypothetical protein